MDKSFFSAKLNQETPPSVIHGWKATDLLLMMVKRKINFQNPISRQNFANAFAETPNLNLEVRHMQRCPSVPSVPLIAHFWVATRANCYRKVRE